MTDSPLQFSAFLWSCLLEIRATSPLFLSCVLNPSSDADGSEQDQRHDEVRHKGNDPGRHFLITEPGKQL